MSTIPKALLREVWRVLAPSGRMMAVIPNRRGVWTGTDPPRSATAGRIRVHRSHIWLRGQTWFTPTAWGEALSCRRFEAAGSALRHGMGASRRGAVVPFPGVHIVEATKQVYRAIPAHRERTRLNSSIAPGVGAVVIAAGE